MPEGTKVHKMYKARKREGYPVVNAVRIAKAKTGMSLKTGKKSKHGKNLHHALMGRHKKGN